MAAKKGDGKGLQKLTLLEDKLHDLLKRNRIKSDDIDQLSESEKKRFNEIVNEKIIKSDGPGRGRILKKIDDILSEETRGDFWEYNHLRIMTVISSLLKEYGRLPSTAEIAQKADLSRPTVYRHLREYRSSKVYQEQLEKLKILSINVIAEVYKCALAGDIGASKLFLNCMGFLNGGQGNTQIQNQNNFIQINGMILNQETVDKCLNSEQLFIIESVLKSIIPQP